MIKSIKQFLKLLSLSNFNNWELYEERGWSYEMDYNSKPRKFYRHKKYPYFITNAYVKKPLHITDLVNMFLLNYKNETLWFDETFYYVSD